MATARDAISRLNMNMPPSSIGFQAQSMFSPAMQSYHPAFPMPNSFQTPMQPTFFNQQPPPAPGRPTHHQARASIAHLATAGIHPPTGFPITPLAGHFPRASMAGPLPGPPSAHPFPHRNRRQLSIGGPPKAVLGGPQRKLSPLPPAISPVPPQKAPKITVNLPKETLPGEGVHAPTRSPWARETLDGFVFQDAEILPVDLATAEAFPPDEYRYHVPRTLDVFLPGKRAWDEMRHQEIEQKLEKLGIERGFGSSVPHIYAPHARAASISSPADPQILLYKLNKLQQSQDVDASNNNSLATSPVPPFGGLSSSSQRASPHFMTNRHGYTMSLAQPPIQPFFGNSSSFDPFGSNMGPEIGPTPHSDHNTFQEEIFAPQGRIPVPVASLAPPAAASRPTSRPDFARGFGLDIPEEADEDAENAIEQAEQEINAADIVEGDDDEGQIGRYQPENADETSTTSPTRLHSRHVSKLSQISRFSHASKLSAALSTRSAAGLDEDDFMGDEDLIVPRGVEAPHAIEQVDDTEDAVAEWTGSEDVYLDETSDGEESIGEFSNPSDEERARKARLERRNRRRQSQQINIPRRLPNFPRPPENTLAISLNTRHAQEDDIISNPSDEGRINEVHGEYLNMDYYPPLPPSSDLVEPSLPLPLTHSRATSAQHTNYDPAHAHSQASSSDQLPFVQQPSFSLRKESLNPFAKPFVFGAKRDSGSWDQGSLTPPKAPLKAPPAIHTRLPSFGKPLNVAAPEFKPGGFTFRPPPGVPIMPITSPEVSRSAIEPTINDSPFKVQGREKRQRRGSSSSIEEGDSMTSFKFPGNLQSSGRVHRSPVVQGLQLKDFAEPFTFEGFSAVASLPHVLPQDDGIDLTVSPDHDDEVVPEDAYNDESTATAQNGDVQNDTDELKLPSTLNLKRAPIPLDFKHTVSNNTVPAGLFKALVNGGEDRTRRTVRSRLSSREFFDHDRRPSMDDLDVALIANKYNKSRTRLVTDPGSRKSPPGDGLGGDLSHARRRSSFADAVRPLGRRLSRSPRPINSESSGSEMSLTGRLEARRAESRKIGLETLLEKGLTALRDYMSRETQQQTSQTHAMISEVQSLFRTQLNESTTRSIEASQLDARGELDFQLVKGVVEESNKALEETLKNNLHALRQEFWQIHSKNDELTETIPSVEQLGNRTVSAVIEAISELSARQEAISRSAPGRERDAIVENLMTALTPLVSSLRSEPIDYDFLTSELAQAVKPHISQLIDLASDKQETAGLIIDRLLPMLPSSKIDADEITRQITAEVRRVIAPIDAFEIKEQVADLVVERLDSRLAVRDKSFNMDTISSKVMVGISQPLEHLQGVPASLEQLATSQASFASRQEELLAAQSRFTSMVTELPVKFSDGLQSLKALQAEILAKVKEPVVGTPEPDPTTLSLRNAVEEISLGQKEIASHAEDLRGFHQVILEKLDVLPASLQSATEALKNNHNEFLTSHEATKRELDELRKSNTDYQVQLSKARGAHGQVRVEKDALSEKLEAVEADRDRFRNQIQNLQTSASESVTQVALLEAKNKELEDALAQALTRLQASDVATQTNQKHIEELQTSNRELTAEKQALKHTVDTLDVQITFVSREKESALQGLEALRQQNDQLTSQQLHWDELYRTAEKIDVLTNLIGQADNEELKDLRRYKDRTRTLEAEHTTLQKRYKEQETKASNSEKTATTARQSLAQAQQRSSEWERRAKEFEGQSEMMKTQLEQAEQIQIQLEADNSSIKLQLEEQEANNRLNQDKENELEEQIRLLEAKCKHLQTELQRAVQSPNPYHNMTNGTSHLPRPDSRASTIYYDRSSTPQIRPSQHNTPPQPTVWDSMHAPTTRDESHRYSPLASNIHAPRGKYPNSRPIKSRQSYQSQPYPTAASPTPSTVSIAPTLGDDGWYS